MSGANLIQAITVAGMFGLFFLGALYLQRVLGYDALQTGLAFLPATIVMGTLSIGYSQRLTMRFGARRTLVPGLALVAVGLGLFTQVPVDGSYATNVLPAMVLMGCGIGIAFPALMQLSMSGATESDAGLASGLVNTTMQVGGALGLALLATFAATRTNNRLAAGDSQAEALTSGYRLAFVIGTGAGRRRPSSSRWWSCSRRVRRRSRRCAATAAAGGGPARTTWPTRTSPVPVPRRPGRPPTWRRTGRRTVDGKPPLPSSLPAAPDRARPCEEEEVRAGPPE